MEKFSSPHDLSEEIEIRPYPPHHGEIFESSRPASGNSNSTIPTPPLRNFRVLTTFMRKIFFSHHTNFSKEPYKRCPLMLYTQEIVYKSIFNVDGTMHKFSIHSDLPQEIEIRPN